MTISIAMVTGLVAGLVAKKITVLDGRLLFKDSTFFDVPEVSNEHAQARVKNKHFYVSKVLCWGTHGTLRTNAFIRGPGFQHARG